jgi:hypothetical protein
MPRTRPQDAPRHGTGVPPPMPSPTPAQAPAPAPSQVSAVRTAAPAEAPPLDAADELHPRLTFWQEPWVQNVLPLATSLALHIGLIVLGIVLVKTVPLVFRHPEEQVVPVDAAIVEGGEIGAIPNPGLGGDPNRPAASDQVPENSVSDGWNMKPSKSVENAVLGGAADTASDTVIGLGVNAALGKGSATGTGVGTGVGTGDGKQAPFGLPGGGSGIGPKAPFMGQGGNASTVAYVCDASGSMMGLPFDLLKIELRKAVDVLKVNQAFNIIFFQKGGFEALSKGSLAVANPNNKQKAYDFLQNLGLGSDSNPIPGLKAALAQKPQLIYLLTDGDFETGLSTVTNKQVIDELRRLNADKKTRINTIAFFSPDAPQSERKVCEDLLRTIASENGGKFKVVLTTDLQK